MKLNPHVMELMGTGWALLYNIIINKDTQEKLQAVLDFKSSTVEIESVILHVQSLSAV